jgi:GWxTD domain-containing protein
MELASEGSAAPGQSMFDSLYPGFNAVRASDSADLNTSEPGIALLLLASNAEKKAWDAVSTPAQREIFMADFWKKRDLTPDSGINEFKQEFHRRVAFADQAFAVPDARGSMTDRGRVFVLLGEPAYVRRRPINSSDGVRLVEEAIDIVNGTMENWVYSKEQLPLGALTQPTVMYRFVTQQGIGNAVLQQDRAIGRHVLQTARGIPDRD